MKLINNSISHIRTASKAVIFAALILPSSACRKFIEVNTPSTAVSTESAFKNDETASAVLTGIYSVLYADFNTPNLYGSSLYTELSGDNLQLYDQDANFSFRDFYRHELTQNGFYFWRSTYNIIYVCNSSIEQLLNSKSLTPSVRDRLLGEALFMRAFSYFYLANFYGEVPLALISNYKVNTVLSRSSVEAVYQQINEDLTEAAKVMSNTYVGSIVSKATTERLRPNLSAVYALQARVFLYQKKYAEAESAASKVISETSLYNLTSPENSLP